MFRAEDAAPAAPVGRALGPAPVSFPPRSPERLPRRVLLRLGGLQAWLEVALDRLVSAPLNPLYHSGSIAVFSLAVATVTGIYLFLFYRVGTAAAHASIEGIMAQPLGIGAFMRSLHRYSSDAAVLAAALHGLKMLVGDRFWGARWIGWVTGLALLGLVWFTGATGYWLVWDTQALVLSLTTARWLDVLPIFAEPIIQTFLSNARIQTFLFFIVLFLHITVPLLIGVFFWLHVMRLARARFFPPRAVVVVTGVALGAASLLWPVSSGPPADPARLPGVVRVDWFYFGYFPLTRLDPRAGWLLLVGAGGLLLALPWLLRGPAPARARVAAEACTGCTRCYKDCPYDAIVMVPRPEGGRPKTLAVVNPARCVGCGICVGACDTGGILLGEEPVPVLAAAVTARVGAARARDPQAPPVLVFTCRLLARLEGRLDADGMLAGVPGTAVLGLPCVGLLHPDTIRRALLAGAAGVFVAGCVPEDCQFREGSAWLADRLAGRRLPAARRLPAGRIRLRFYAPVEAARFVADVRAFAGTLPSSEGSAVIDALPHRRPGPARLVVFGLVLLAVSWGLATFSAWPWTAARPDAATLRISVKAVTALTAPAVPRADVGDLPVHMRPLDPSRPTTGRRGDAVLTVAVDGVRVLERTYRPTGLRRDGPVYGYEEIPVVPGRHVVQAALTDLSAGPGSPVSSSTAIAVTVASGDAPLLEFRDGAWRRE